MASETVNSDSSDVEQESTENQETVDMRILDPDTIDLDLNHGRIGKIENLEPLTQLETLCLRWNMIKKIENLSTLGSTLTELELYDNQITVLENLDSLVNLEILDVSHNRLRKIQGLGMVLKGFILDMLLKLQHYITLHNISSTLPLKFENFVVHMRADI